jgi:hypothetical protein
MKAKPAILVLLLLLSLAFPVGADVPQEVKPLLGSWVAQEDNQSVLRFEPTKCTFASVGRPGLQIVRAAYQPGKVVTYSWARKAEYRFAVKDQILTLTYPDGTTKTYRKLDRTPAEAEVKPVTLGAAKELPKERIQTIKEELAQRTKLDQKVRSDRSKPGEMAKVDADNTAYLIKLVEEIGWIDVERFGTVTANQAFLLMQHSGHLPLMTAALPLIEKDARAKRLSLQAYALLFDRLQVMLGEKQLYGTQLGENEKGELVLLALTDRPRVDALRKEMGLGSLADYLQRFERQNGGKKIAFQDDE